MATLQPDAQSTGGSSGRPMDIDASKSEKPLSYTRRRPQSTEGRRASSVPAKRPKLYDAQVGYVYDDNMLFHACADGHPEQPARIMRIHDALKSANLLEKMKQIPIREVERDEVLLVHSQTLWDRVMAISEMDEQSIADSAAYYHELSLYVHPRTPFCARLSCGGVIEATLAVARGLMKKSFAIVRPPGHHSEPDEHMGFCFFNNVAVAARVTQQLTKVKKILILDWDVHHGNGTQRAFDDDPSVLYISLHRYENGEFYPSGKFGALQSCGVGEGLGYSVNIPWPEKGMGDAEYIHAFQSVVMPIAMEFAPELVIISAGFDAARGDDLGECDVTPAGYAHMTHMLSGLAGGRIVVALEGGYSLDAISNSALAVAKVLLGEAPPMLPKMVANVAATETVWQVAMEQGKYWKSLNPRATEPREEVEDMSFSIPDLLKAHRAEFLFRSAAMLQVPFVSPALDERFNSQVAASADIMTNKNLVVFIHEYGNLRVELQSALTCDLHMEHSYMLDFSKDLLGWLRRGTHPTGLLDINVYPKPYPTTKTKNKGVEDDYSSDVMVYLWDNYIQLTDARQIVLVGHGPGCKALMHLLNNRAASVVRSVVGIVQVVGDYNVPATPNNMPELRKWYRDNSLVILPKSHRYLANGQLFKRHGRIYPSEETKPVMLIRKELPIIRRFVEQALNKSLKPVGNA